MEKFPPKRRTILKAALWGIISAPAAAWASVSAKGLHIDSDRIKQQTSSEPNATFSIPSQFSIELEGSTETATFGPLSAMLEVLPASAEDPNSLVVTIYMATQRESDLVNGSIFWQSFISDNPKRNEHFSLVTVIGNQVNVQIHSSDDSFRSDVMWFTQITGDLATMVTEAGGSNRSAATPNSGTMSFIIQDGEVSGDIELEGITDLGLPSTYKARFSSE